MQSYDPTARLRCRIIRATVKDMAKVSKIDFDDPASIDEEEDEETFAAIDDGLRDVEAGRTVPTKEARKLLPKWINASSSRKER